LTDACQLEKLYLGVLTLVSLFTSLSLELSPNLIVVVSRLLPLPSEVVSLTIKMSARRESLTLENAEKKEPVEPASLGEHARGRQFSVEQPDVDMVEADQAKLHRRLKGRHMQMIAM
jgi:hypothetical protein